MDKGGKRLDDAMKAYSEVVGVSRRQLDRQLDKIETWRTIRQKSETTPQKLFYATSITAQASPANDSDRI